MKKWLFVVIFSFIIGLLGFVMVEKMISIPTIIYFPPDENTSFTSAQTKLDFFTEQNNNTYEIKWTSKSSSDKEIYLRQDVSLFFDNGQLRGVMSKWSENEALIELKKRLTGENSSYYQAISYHHGEIHYPDDKIKSIQQMSYDELYVIDSPTTPLESFQKPRNEFDSEWKEILDVTTKQQLLYHWHQLMHHFNIKPESYYAVPLTSLHRYNTKKIPGKTKEQTDKIIGQLWEGLYKNYIIKATSEVQNKLTSYVPLILFSKEGNHLFVLYELNGQKEKLIQAY